MGIFSTGASAISFLLLFALVIAISVHEFSHALMGYLEGDNTAKYEGRLTLNPLAHLDLLGSLMLFFVGFGWGKPVPFNPFNLKHRKWGPTIVALVGPISNLLVAILAGLVFKILVMFTDLTSDNLLILFLQLLGIVNIGLALFNLLPIPPLDGAKLLHTLLPDRFYQLKENLLLYGPYMLLGLLVLERFFKIPLFQGLTTLTTAIFSFFFLP